MFFVPDLGDLVPPPWGSLAIATCGCCCRIANVFFPALWDLACCDDAYWTGRDHHASGPEDLSPDLSWIHHSCLAILSGINIDISLDRCGCTCRPNSRCPNGSSFMRRIKRLTNTIRAVGRSEHGCGENRRATCSHNPVTRILHPTQVSRYLLPHMVPSLPISGGQGFVLLNNKPTHEFLIARPLRVLQRMAMVTCLSAPEVLHHLHMAQRACCWLDHLMPMHHSNLHCVCLGYPIRKTTTRRCKWGKCSFLDLGRT